MASTTQARRVAAVVLGNVPYEVYATLRDAPANGHLRMTFHDGTLEIMSPEYVHEVPSRRLGMLVAMIAGELGLPCTGVASTTFRRKGRGKLKGKGKEPDQGFYLANEARILGKESIDLDADDPPPDLWIEVDNRASSRGRLPLYAALGVPEVWRYHARKKTLWFGRLVAGSAYEPIDRSLALPMLTPGMVLEILLAGHGRSESAWYRLVIAWIGETLDRPA